MRDSIPLDRLYELYLRNCEIQESLGQALLEIEKTKRLVHKICDPIKPYKGGIKNLTLK